MIHIVCHPGPVPTWNKTTGHCPWNCTGCHRRKFIKWKGDAVGYNQLLSQVDLFFFAEYEPDSTVKARAAFPKGIHVPCHVLPPAPVNALNTDPYVFDKSFKYFCCRRNNTIFNPGDIILFGNVKQPGGNFLFELDTVIVVDKIVPVSSYYGSYYYFISLQQSQGGSPSSVIEGVQYGGDLSVPFSFVPCSDSPGMKKPILDFSALGIPALSPTNRQFQHGPVNGPEDFWHRLSSQVLSSGCLLGTRFDTI